MDTTIAVVRTQPENGNFRPALILAGFDSNKATGIHAFAVMPPSFSSLVRPCRSFNE